MTQRAYRYRFYPAFANFWAGRTKYPNFKKKRSGGSAEFTRSAFKWKDGQLWLAKCSEPLPIRWKWYGRTLVKIDRWFPSSKRCRHCGHVVDKLPLNVREWNCPKCGTHHDRDINAAQNILAAGLAVIVCGANIRPDGHKSKGQLRKTRKGKKQKPKS